MKTSTPLSVTPAWGLVEKSRLRGGSQPAEFGVRLGGGVSRFGRRPFRNPPSKVPAQSVGTCSGSNGLAANEENSSLLAAARRGP